MSDDPSLALRLAHVEAELLALRRELRTNRVVVVDDDGVERVVLAAVRRTGSVLVKVEAEQGRTTGLELYASHPTHKQPTVGLVEVSDGDVVDEWWH
ncbi:MAG: hypothetical protein KDA94_10920 [Acidimicrobiales bacterium]|nr:hypothetical protein [Acidimicrobiales bacterium]